MPIPVGGPFYCVGVDIMELPQTVNGNRYVISFVNCFVKRVESFPSDNQTSETIVRLLIDHVIRHHEVHETLISDCGPNLLSTLMQEVFQATGMQKFNTGCKLMGKWTISIELCKPCLPHMLQSLVGTGMNIFIICSLHIELNPLNLLVGLYFSCYMGMMLGFPVKACYP